MESIILLIGNTGSGKTTVGNILSTKLNLPFFSIDRMRKAHGNGKISGEYIAWGKFLGTMEKCEEIDLGAIFEFSGTGKNVYAVRNVLAENYCNKLLVHLSCDINTCLERVKKRGFFNIPFPYSMDIEKVIKYMDETLKETPWLATTDEIGLNTTELTSEGVADAIIAKLKEL